MKIDADRPNSTAFARSIASSSVVEAVERGHGPKTSSHESIASSARPRTASARRGTPRRRCARRPRAPCRPRACRCSIAVEDVVHLLLVHERADLGLGIGRIADLAALDALQQPAAELVVDRRLDVDAPRRGALLARRPERARVGGLDRTAEVGVGHHDQRVVPAELELHALAEAPSPGRAPGDRPRPSP